MPATVTPDSRNLVAALALNTLLFKVASDPESQPQYALDIAMEAYDVIQFLLSPSTPYCLHTNTHNPSYRSYHRVNARQCVPSAHAPGLSIWRVQEVQGGTKIGRGNLVSVWLDGGNRIPLIGLVRRAVSVEEGLVRLTLVDKDDTEMAILFIPAYLTTLHVVEKVLLRIIRPSEPLIPTPPISTTFATTSDTGSSQSFRTSTDSHRSAGTADQDTTVSVNSHHSSDADTGEDGCNSADGIKMTSMSSLMTAGTRPTVTDTTTTVLHPYAATGDDVREAIRQSTPKVYQAAAQALDHYIRYENVPFWCIYSH